MSVIADFIEPVRWLIGDHHDDARMFEDSQYARGIRTIVKGGLLPGYTLVGNDAISPNVADGKDYFLLSAKVALGFVASVPSRQSVRTRAWSNQLGNYETLIGQLEQLIYDSEHGSMGMAFQSYAGFINGYSGLDRPWTFMTRLNFTGPVAQVTMPYWGNNKELIS